MSLAELSSYFSEVRSRFPLLSVAREAGSLVYLDSAATTLKPRQVVDRIARHYLLESANVHRGAHRLSDEATQMFEDARKTVATFLGCDSDEIIFTRNTTESMNLVAQTWGRKNVKAGDVIALTELEHHGNIVPWQMLRDQVGAKISVAGMDSQHGLDHDSLDEILSQGARVVAVTGASNALGVRPDLRRILNAAKAAGVTSVVDAAQLVSQKPVNVRDLGCDFLAFSAHKLFGPTGLGVLYGRRDLLRDLPPWQGGGSMISEVTFEKTTYNEAPFRFEAGTPHIAGAIGLGAAIEFVTDLGWEKIERWEDHLLKLAAKGLREIPDVEIYGDIAEKGPILSFNLKGHHHSDVGQLLDQQGVAVRAGHHCTQPLMRALGVPGTVRASFSIYNDTDDVDRLIEGVRKAREMLQ